MYIKVEVQQSYHSNIIISSSNNVPCIDSWVLDREVAAVQEWVGSGRTFHVMRDHPNHKAVMLAGT